MAVATARKPTLVDRLFAKLAKSGVSRRKAASLAKELAPVARNAVKKELELKAQPKPESKVETKAVVKERAVKVNGLSLRLDLPSLPSGRDSARPQGKEVTLLRVLDGWTTNGTYLAAAVKGDKGIIAVRQLIADGTHAEAFNTKFYPDMAYWGWSEEKLRSLGANNFLRRPPYERMHMNQRTLDQLLARVAAEAKGKSRVKNWLDRLLAISFKPLSKAFNLLYSSARPNARPC